MQEYIIITLNTWMSHYPLLIKMMPRLGDIFVFTYPPFLVYLYFFHKRKHTLTVWSNPKTIALSIFSTTIIGIVINYLIKAWVHQQRPFYSIDLPILPKDDLILNTIPTDAFPSDHASVGMCMALATLLRWYRTQDKIIITIGWMFLLFTLTMNIARITMGVHRPVDIIWWMIVGIISAIIITHPHIHNKLSNTLYTRIISIQEQLFMKLK